MLHSGVKVIMTRVADEDERLEGGDGLAEVFGARVDQCEPMEMRGAPNSTIACPRGPSLTTMICGGEVLVIVERVGSREHWEWVPRD